MRVRNLSNSVKRNDEKNTVNSWRLEELQRFLEGSPAKIKF